jgi:hydroxymethylpyrimidine pyrophosphatase-like HAD family hydrolase
MKIAVDFDGTIVEAAFPEIGEEKMFAFQTLLELQKRGHQLILWTSRVGKELEEAVEFCRKNGIEFYAVNKNYPEEIVDETVSRKIVTDLYIDDRVVGGFPGWGEIFQMVHPGDPVYQSQMARTARGKSSVLNGIKKIFGS